MPSAINDGFVYMITDDVIHERNLLGLRVGFAAATPEELAVDLEIPPEALARTVRDYNEAAARGEDPRFHKRAPFLQPIGVPPASGIGAIDLRVDHGAIYATFTLGGLVTDPDGAAVDGAGQGHPGSLRGRADGGQPGGQPLRQWDQSRRRLLLRPPRRPSCRRPGRQRALLPALAVTDSLRSPTRPQGRRAEDAKSGCLVVSLSAVKRGGAQCPSWPRFRLW